jgi:hypothetical protein
MGSHMKMMMIAVIVCEFGDKAIIDKTEFRETIVRTSS